VGSGHFGSSSHESEWGGEPGLTRAAIVGSGVAARAQIRRKARAVAAYASFGPLLVTAP
jgi:hypothetical protein